ncbi:hypothetical protein SPF06_03460 [Sinomonas sp. JGH33]|uniref:Uncharacterized protein n=1 Tax=Sinomonas terricola TaxID=3110330 RepID=A0ABU5T3Q7_9MICC|nr:hypothetical protein [Sinomonas sp. JGH33]MEA5453771.1 hypothetical protein [Sinomonas sp. JGH33]
MKKLSIKGKVAVAVTTAGLVGIGGGAFAYWTTTGSGSGNAAASAGGQTVTLHATFTGGLTPGQSQSVAYTADNANDTSTVVGALSASVSTSNAQCLPSWFTVSANTSNSTVAAHASGVSVGSGTLAFNDSAADQDACKGATITVSVTSN